MSHCSCSLLPAVLAWKRNLKCSDKIQIKRAQFGDGTHLRGIRGTAVGVEATVMTWRICSKADRPPPIWKATWSALFCRGTKRDGTEWEINAGTDRDYTIPTAGKFLQRQHQTEIGVIPEVSLSNLKSAQPGSALQEVNIQWKANALQALICFRVVSVDGHRLTWDWGHAEQRSTYPWL